MTTELEKRLLTLEQEVTKTKKVRSKRSKILLLTVVLVFSLAGYLFYENYINKTPSNTLPIPITKQAGFPIYYPATLPSGYRLDEKSVMIENNILFFTIQKDRNKVSISEQATPNPAINLKAIQDMNTSFKKVDVPAGEAIAGISTDLPVGIVVTNTTLINLSATKNVPQDVLIKLIKALSSL